MLKYKMILFLLIIIIIPISAIEIEQNSTNIELMPISKIYIDSKNLLSIDEVKEKKFIKNSKPIISMGFNPSWALWIKFTIKNKTDKKLEKIIEYANPITEDILFFDKKKTIIEGSWHIPKSRKSINPIFHITLNPYEEQTYYIKVHSTISTVIAQLILYNSDDFIYHDFRHKILIVIFFTIIITLLIYNFFIYFFTKDRAYLYYILYLMAIIINESTYIGVAQLYILSPFWTIIITKYIMILIAFLILSVIQFTREFLQTKQFKKIDTLLKNSIYLIPIFSLLSCNNFLFNSNIIIIFLPLAILVIFTGFYALWHDVREAKFYVIGWSLVILSLIITNLQTLGIIDMNYLVKYINDVSFTAEAFLFSIALAHRIKITNKKLLTIQKQEQQRLEYLVAQKTKELNIALEKRELLYKELNHRVRNNFQMILSMVKLQIMKSKNKTELITIKDRINSIYRLYEILQINQNRDIDTKSYFEDIINNISKGFTKDINIKYNIDYNLEIEELLYCGLILNELVTNSFKYAFDKKGDIYIYLYKKDNGVYFTIYDNGKGFSRDKNSNSLGLLIVDTLVTKQLLGDWKIESKNHTKIEITWIN